MPRLPPLNALRAFEAGARRLSFARAADDLSVTPTAISHQVRNLEEWLGTPLFRRQGRGLLLTAAGQQLQPVVAEAFERIATTAEAIRAAPRRPVLTVSVTPTFGSRWLAARLGGFWVAHPEIDLRVHHSVHLSDFERDDVDIAVRWGLGNWPGTRSEPLMDAVAVPLCSPRLLEGPEPLCRVQDLSRHVLLHDSGRQEWTEWLIASGLDPSAGERGPVIDDPNAIARAAIAGHGIMLAPASMLGAEIEAGLLVAPFAGNDGPTPAYYLVYSERSISRPWVQAFRDFIVEQASTQSGEGGNQRGDGETDAAQQPGHRHP